MAVPPPPPSTVNPGALRAAAAELSRARPQPKQTWQQVVVRNVGFLGKLFPKGCTLLIVGAVLATVASRSDGPVYHVSRTLGAGADVAEGLAELALSAIASTGSLSQSMSTWAVDVLTLSRGWSQDLWEGVDLVNVVIEKRQGVIVADGPVPMAAWIVSPHGMHLHGGDEVFVESMLAAVQSIDKSIPFVRSSFVRMNVSAKYNSYLVEAAWTRSGHLLLKWIAAGANFDVVWANPLWDAVGLDPLTDSALVFAVLEEYFRKLPDPPQSRPAVVSIEITVWQALRSSVDRWGRYLHSCFFRGVSLAAPLPADNRSGVGHGKTEWQ